VFGPKLKAYLSSWATVLLLAGCGAGNNASNQKDQLLQSSESATFDTVTRLGSHHFEAELVRESLFNGQKTVEKVVVDWGDWDNFQLQRYRNDRLRAETRVVTATAYAKSGKGRFRQASDAELYRVEMRHSASFWGRALEAFRGLVHAERKESTTIDGRTAHRYELSFRSEANAPSRGHQAIELIGEMWIDEITAIRLSGQLEGRYLKNGHPDKEVRISLKLKRSEIGIQPVIERPRNPRKSGF